MKEKENCESLFDENIEGSWELDIPNTSNEEFHDSENDQYLVPIFAKENDTIIFRGNGVIVGSYLVTAAHVAQTEQHENYEVIWYKYEGELLRVSDENVAHDGRNVGVIEGDNDDVIIYKLKNVIGSFVCNGEEIHESMKLLAYPYTNFDDKLVKSGGMCKIQSLEVRSGKEDNLIWKNCFKVNYPFRCTYGNSGSAVFVKNVLYGILIERYDIGEGAFGKVIDARYIKNIIEKYELEQLQEG